MPILYFILNNVCFSKQNRNITQKCISKGTASKYNLTYSFFFFFKIGVNIQKLTHLACLLSNSHPSQGEYLAQGLLLSVASSQNGKMKLLLTYSTKNIACVLLALLKELTFVTNIFCKNPSEHELHLTSMISTQNSPSYLQQRPRLHLYITVWTDGPCT